MIIPIHGLQYHHFEQPIIGDEVFLVKEKENLYDSMAIAAYNKNNQKIGYISKKSCYNEKVYNKMRAESIKAILWSVAKNQILVEIDQFRHYSIAKIRVLESLIP